MSLILDIMSLVGYNPSMSSTNPTKLAARRYIIHLSATMVAYVAIVFTTTTVLGRMPAGSEHSPLWYLLVLLPLIPVGFLVPIMVRYFRETDEFERRIVTESLAIAAGITA